MTVPSLYCQRNSACSKKVLLKTYYLGVCCAWKFERKSSLLHAVIFKHEIIKEIWITVKELFYSLFFLLVIMFLTSYTYSIHSLLIKFIWPNSRRSNFFNWYLNFLRSKIGLSYFSKPSPAIGPCIY